MHFDRNRRKTLLLAMAASAALLTSGCDSHSPAPVVAASTPPGSTAAPTPAPVPTQAPPDAREFTTTGPLIADQQADIGADRDGRVVQINAQIGDHVKAGQLLAQLDDRILRSAVDAQKAHIAEAQAQVRNWQAEQASARADLERANALHDAKILSDQDWEICQYKLDQANAQVVRYQSEENAAEAGLASATVLLEQSRIVAPFSGVIGRSSIRIDQEVKAGDALFWITAEAPLRVFFTVPETLMASFSAGKALDLTTADYPSLHQAGRIYRVSPVVDPASGSVQVIGSVAHPSPLLKPGMTMQVRLAP